MTTGTTSLLSLALPVQGELDGTWGDVVNYGITDYVDIAVAGTLTLTGDGAVTLSKTAGTSTGTNIGSTTAQYAIVKVTGTLTTTKVITAPSTSKTYIIDNAATGGSVTFKASGQTGVTVTEGERCTVYFNGTDYVKVSTLNVDGVSTISFGSTGLTPATATSGAVTVAGTLAVSNGGTGVTTSTGTGSVVLSNSPTLVTPALGTPSSATLTNATGLPISTGVSGLGSGVATALAVNVGSAGAPVVNGGALGTPSSGTLTNATGLPISTGVSGLGSGIATFLATPSSANLAAALTDETGTGANVFANSPTLVTPALGTPSSATLTNATGLPLTTGVTGTLPIANGGTGTTTPNLTAGSGVTITGTWPNQTIAATGSGGTITSVTASSPLASSGGTSPNISITSSTGSGAVVLASSPTLVTPALGTPSSGNFSSGTFTWPTFNQNTTGTAAGLSSTLVASSGGTGLTSPGTAGNVLTSTGSGWTSSAPTGGAVAGGSIYINTEVISQDYTFPTGSNGMSVGPITIQSGYSVTVTGSQRWVIL